MTSDRWGVPVELGERRVLHPGPLRWLRALGWMVLLTALAFVLPGLAISFFDHLLPDTGWGEFAANCGGAALCLAIYGLLIPAGEARGVSELSLKALPGGLFVGLLLGLVMFACVMAVMAAFHLYDMRWQGIAPAWSGTAKSVQSGVMEEVFTRAIMLRLLWRAFGPWAALAISAAFFGFAHLANPNASPFAAFCIAVEAGIMLAGFYMLTGRLWVSIGAHAAWNFTQGYLFGAPVSGTDFGPALMKSTAIAGHPEWLTGGAFGPEASLPALFVGTLFGVAAVWLAWKAGRFAPARPATLAQAEPFS